MKRIAQLINKFKNNEDGFKSSFCDEFNKHTVVDYSQNNIDVETILTEILSKELSVRIIANLIWLNKDEYIIFLREDKLKRILREF